MVKRYMKISWAILLLAATLAAQDEADRLGRTTPKTSFLGFLRSAHEGSYDKAAEYLQLKSSLKSGEKEEIARQFEVVLDRGYEGKIHEISSQPEGNVQDGMAPDRENVGILVGREQTAPVVLVRVTQGGRQLWLFSAETVAMAPQFFSEFGFPAIEQLLPRVMIETHVFEMPLWVFVAIFAMIPLSFGLAWAFLWLFLRALPAAWNMVRRPNTPLVLFLGLLLHSGISRMLGMPLMYRIWYERVLTILWLVLFVWLTFGLIGYIDRRVREYLTRNNLSSTQSLLQLGRRLFQVLVVLGAFLVGMRSFGYDITAILAGLGIGGLAVAFAAQKTLENVFGGLTLLSDQSIRVGDTCQVGDALGTVEDIGLRATRFRTVQRSTLYIPNGQLATMNIENLGQRDRILFRHTVGVKYGISPNQMRALLDDLRKLLADDERVAQDAQRVRFLKYGAYSLDIDVFAQILTNDFVLFLEIQEDLLLKIMDVVSRHETDFAFPTQTLHFESTSDSSQTT